MTFVTVNQLTKQFDKNIVVDHLSFSLQSGSCVALLGPNGAGKTTTLRMLAGLMQPTNGSIDMEGNSNKSDYRANIGYLPQYPVFHSWMTGMEFLIYVARLAHLTKREATTRAEAMLDQVGISEAKHRRIGKYSGGMKQRLGIAQAMIHQPRLLLLDEPVSSLDPIGRREVLDLLEELKQETTILFSTHILSDAEEVSDELLLLHNGCIVESGTLHELKEAHPTTHLTITFTKLEDYYITSLQQLQEVTEVIPEQSRVTIQVTDVQVARHKILSLASEENWPITSFEVGQASLEDLFMRVVNR